mgnify:CR=1 FL=1
MNFVRLYNAIYKEVIKHATFEKIDRENQKIKLIDENDHTWHIQLMPEWSTSLREEFHIEAYGLFGETETEGDTSLLWFDVWITYKGEHVVLGNSFSPDASLDTEWYHYRNNSLKQFSDEEEIDPPLQQIKSYILEHIIKEHPKCRLYLLYETEI